MRTVENLIEELQKFPKDATCESYEGEVTGITIHTIGGKAGFIYLSGTITQEDERRTELCSFKC